MQNNQNQKNTEDSKEYFNEILQLKCFLPNPDKQVKDYLKEYPNIDLTYDEGIYFQLAIQDNKSNLLDILLNHYEKNNIKVENQYQSLYTKHKLKEIISEILEYVTCNEEVKTVIDKYLNLENNQSSDGENRESEFDELNISFPITYTNLVK